MGNLKQFGLSLATVLAVVSNAASAKALLRSDFENYLRNNNTAFAQLLSIEGYAYAEELTRLTCNKLHYVETTDVYRAFINNDIPSIVASDILSFSTGYTCP